jgi:hypothetical protein
MDDVEEYVMYGVLVLLIILLVWFYFKQKDLQTLYDQSQVAQTNLGTQLSNQKTGDMSQIADLKLQIDKLNSQIVAQKPQLDELAKYKSVISSNLYASLQASNALFGTSSNSEQLRTIAILGANIATKVGTALCDVAQALAKTMLQTYDLNPSMYSDQLCNPSVKSKVLSSLNRNGEFSGSDILTIIGATFDLFQAYFCGDRTRDNLAKILTALVNTICNPSTESLQLYSALYKQVLYDIDNNYKKGLGSLNPKPGVYTPGTTYTQPGYYDPNTGISSAPYSYTTRGHYLANKTGDPIIDNAFSALRIVG